MKRTFAFLAALVLSACADDPVRVASKDFSENRILAEMFALLIEEAGIPVDRQIPLGETATVFEALRTGAIDVYPEYTGTGLSLLGLPPGVDKAAARARIAEGLDSLGITLLEPLGFETSYAVVVEPELARTFKLDDVSDLAVVAPELRLVVAEGFASRPQDGLQAFRDRFGLSFETVEVIPEEQRRAVYDYLLDDRADLAVGFGTDAEIAAYGLKTIELGDDFGLRYEAIPLVATAALTRHPEIRDALGALAGALDTETMRRLNGAVALEARAPRAVAEEALAQMGLVGPDTLTGERPYRIAVREADLGTPMANEVLRAARLTVEERGVTFVETSVPTDAIFDRTARVALSPSIAMFQVTELGAMQREDLEAIAAVGSYLLHVLAPSGGPTVLGNAKRIAAGPEGSPSYILAQAVARRSETPKEVIALNRGDAGSIADAVKQGAADAGIVLAPVGRIDVAEALDAGGVTLIPGDDWWIGAARVAFPFLGAATIPKSAYGGGPTPTLSMQAVVLGPAPLGAALGQQGPSTYTEAPQPVTDRVVLAFNDYLGAHPDIGYALRPSAALLPKVNRGREALNRTPGYTALSIGIVVFLIWAAWLLTRRETSRGRR